MQDDKTKLKLLVKMVKVLSERVHLISQFSIRKTGFADIDIKLQEKIKNIEKDIE